MKTQALIRIPSGAIALPDNEQWDHRFQIRSASSNRLYTVARNKKSGKYGCSCPGYLTKRKCKHLIQGCGLSESQIHGREQLTGSKHKQLGS